MNRDLSLLSSICRGESCIRPSEGANTRFAPTGIRGFSEFLSQLSSDPQSRQKFGSCLDKLLALRDQYDPLLFAKELFNIGCELADRGMTEGAITVFATLVGARHAVPLQQQDSAFQDILARAQEQLNAIQGNGNILPRVEHLAKQMPKEIFNLSGFSAMAAAMPTFRFTTTAAKAILGTGIGPWLVANTIGFLAESAMFTSVGRGVRELSACRGTACRAPTSWAQEWVYGMPMLLGLKTFGGLAGMTGHALLAKGYGYTALQSFSLWGMHQVAMLNGIMFGNHVSGLNSGRDFWMQLAEAGVTAVHFNAMGPMLGAVANPHEALRRDFAESFRELKTAAVFPENLILGDALVTATTSGLTLPHPEGLSSKNLPLLSEMQEERSGVVVPLFPNSIPPEGPMTPSEPVFSDQTFERALKLISEVDPIIEKINQAMPNVVMRGQVIVGHVEKGRRAFSFVQQMLRDCMLEISEYHRTITVADEAIQEINRLSFSLHNIKSDKGCDAYRNLQYARKKLSNSLKEQNLLLGDIKNIRRQLTELFVSPLPAMSSFASATLVSSFKILEDKVYIQRGHLAFAHSLFVSPPADSLSLARVQGMFAGILAKEFLRYHPPYKGLLDLESPRGNDDQIIKDIFTKLFGVPPTGHHLDILNDRSSLTKTAVIQVSGEFYSAWLSVYVPALVAISGGRYSIFIQRMQTVESVLDPQSLEATRVIAAWLCKALHAEGEPREWLKEVPRPAGSGRLEIVKHVHDAFFRAPNDFKEAMRFATQAPTEMREDVISLTAALLGAYHGRGMIPLLYQDESTHVALKHVLPLLRMHLRPALRIVREEKTPSAQADSFDLIEFFDANYARASDQIGGFRESLERFLEKQKQGLTQKAMRDLIQDLQKILKILEVIGKTLERTATLNTEVLSQYPDLLRQHQQERTMLLRYQMLFRNVISTLEKYSFGLKLGGIRVEHVTMITAVLRELQVSRIDPDR